DGALDIPRLQRAELLLVLVVHQLATRSWVVEPNSVADLMGSGVPAVVDVQIAIESDLPALLGIEADNRALHRAPGTLPGFVGNVCECASKVFELRTDKDACAARVIDLGEPNVGDRLPHVERGTHLVAKICPIEVR